MATGAPHQSAQSESSDDDAMPTTTLIGIIIGVCFAAVIVVSLAGLAAIIFAVAAVARKKKRQAEDAALSTSHRTVQGVTTSTYSTSRDSGGRVLVRATELVQHGETGSMHGVQRNTADDAVVVAVAFPSAPAGVACDDFALKVWLHDLGVGEYEANLRDEGFDTVFALRALAKGDLIELGITKLGHRNAIMHAITLL